MSDHQDRELYDLCKSVYEKTNWAGTTQFYNVGLDDKFEIEVENGWQSEGSSYAFDERHDVPLYTSDYILSILPNCDNEVYWAEFGVSTIQANNNIFTAWWEVETGAYYEGESSSPLKALLKLTLELHKAGKL